MPTTINFPLHRCAAVHLVVERVTLSARLGIVMVFVLSGHNIQIERDRKLNAAREQAALGEKSRPRAA